MRYFLYFAYNGTHFHGWQRQPNAITVQGVMENALTTVLRHPATLTGAGRTDTGVHAESMVAHFDIITPIENKQQFCNHLNSLLPPAIAVRQLRMVQPSAHARFDALSRKYEYRTTMQKDPFLTELTTRIPCNLDFCAMNIAADRLLLQTDFASFCKLHTDVKTTICHLSQAQWIQSNGQWTFHIRADRFLRNMVRAIVGTLFDIGSGRTSMAQFEEILAAAHRTAAGMSAPAQGLFLTDVTYPDTIFCNED